MKLIYFGYDTRTEKPEEVLLLAREWGKRPVCPHWHTTVKREEADYQVLFGIADVSILDRRGQIVYSGGTGVLYTPNGNPDGSGVNLCKLTGG